MLTDLRKFFMHISLTFKENDKQWTMTVTWYVKIV